MRYEIIAFIASWLLTYILIFFMLFPVLLAISSALWTANTSAWKILQYSGSWKGWLRSSSEQYIPAPTPLASFNCSIQMLSRMLLHSPPLKVHSEIGLSSPECPECYLLALGASWTGFKSGERALLMSDTTNRHLFG